MSGKERNQVKRVLFIMIGATVLLVCATTTATSAPDEPDKLVVPVYKLPGTPDKLVVPVYKLPKDVVARVNEAYWAEKHSQ
jgi:hypothetical protein